MNVIDVLSVRKRQQCRRTGIDLYTMNNCLKIYLLLHYDDTTGAETVEGVYSSREILMDKFINHSSMDGYYMEEYTIDSDEAPLRYPLKTIARMCKYNLL